MDKALLNVRKHTERNLNEIINMMSLNPAKRIGMQDSMGSIEIGKLSNIVLLSDDLNIEAVYIKGKKKYSNQ